MGDEIVPEDSQVSRNSQASESYHPDLERYSRQMRFAAIGTAGQKRLLASRVLICGCGALGSVLANTLVRAGVGKLRIVDRDFLETNNLQRQVLYDEEDVAAGLPKAIAAKNKLLKINSQVEVEAIVTDVDHTNITALVEGVDLILDGTDNFETRFLLNDASLKFGIPWVFGGCIGAEGQTMTILPGESACLRCLLQETPPPGSTPTCDSAGILSPIINVIASLEAMEAIKILTGNRDAVNRQLGVYELWDNRARSIQLDSLFQGFDQCLCHGTDFPWLSGERGSHTAVLCGRNAVQLTFPERTDISFEQLAGKLSDVGQVSYNRFLLRVEVDGYTLTIFRDGRTIVSGTDDIAEARSVHARVIGA
jgi:molybdopterin-synthase adenylyltransferase